MLSYIQLSSSTLVYSTEILRSRKSTQHALYKRKNMNKISVQRTINKKARIEKKKCYKEKVLIVVSYSHLNTYKVVFISIKIFSKLEASAE